MEVGKVGRNAAAISEGAGPSNKTLFCGVYESMACAYTLRVIYDLVRVPVTGCACTMMTIVMRLS